MVLSHDLHVGNAKGLVLQWESLEEFMLIQLELLMGLSGHSVTFGKNATCFPSCAGSAPLIGGVGVAQSPPQSLCGG